MKLQDLELTIDGRDYLIDCTIEEDGEVIINRVSVGNRDQWDFNECEITPLIKKRVEEDLRDQIEEIKEKFDYALKACGSNRAREYFLNE